MVSPDARDIRLLIAGCRDAEQAAQYLTENELEDIVDGEPPLTILGELEDLAEVHRALLLVDLYGARDKKRGVALVSRPIRKKGKEKRNGGVSRGKVVGSRTSSCPVTRITMSLWCVSWTSRVETWCLTC